MKNLSSLQENEKMSLKALNYLVQFVKDETGNILNDKAYLFTDRLNPILEKLQINSLDELVLKLENNPTFELKKNILNAMMTHESFFMREDGANQFIAKYITEQNKINHNNIFSIWSCASSQGQELYSLVITLMEHQLLNSSMIFNFLGTDISLDVLNKAREATYSSFEVNRGLSSLKIATYFDHKDGLYQVKHALRSLVRFEQFNLLDPCQRIGKKDIIFCRNVLIYFEPTTKLEILNKLAQQLNDGGILILGSSELISEDIKGLSRVKEINFPVFKKIPL